MLSIKNLSVHYGGIHALRGISFDVPAGKIVTLIGANGAGKSTTLNSIVGLVKADGGSVSWNGREMRGLKTRNIVKSGVVLVPEGRRVFPNLNVDENLILGAYSRNDKAEIAADLERIFALFPRLKERYKQKAGTLSGGEQQMLAVARILRTGARLLLLDEISEGLAPVIVQKLAEMILALKAKGYTIVLVEQNFRFAAPLADRFYVMEHGAIVKQFEQAELTQNMSMLQEYLGV